MSSLRAIARSFARRYLDLRPATVERGRSIVRKTLDAVAQRLLDGRPYLFGDRFSAADLTFASMTAAAVLPARYGIPLPDPQSLPLPHARAWIAEVRDHLAGRYTLRLYEERPRPRSRFCRGLRVDGIWQARATSSINGEQR